MGSNSYQATFDLDWRFGCEPLVLAEGSWDLMSILELFRESCRCFVFACA